MEWCRAAARHLAPGGCLYLLDGHPFVNVFDADDPDLPELRIAPNAQYLGHEAREEWPYTYASERQIASPVKYEWTHSIGGIVNAVVGAGLRIESSTNSRSMVGNASNSCATTAPGGASMVIPSRS